MARSDSHGAATPRHLVGTPASETSVANSSALAHARHGCSVVAIDSSRRVGPVGADAERSPMFELSLHGNKLGADRIDRMTEPNK